MESHYGVGINNRYALFLDQDDLDDEVMLQKAAETAKKSKETQKVNGVPPPAPAPKKDTKPTPAPQTTAPTSKKPEGGKPLKGEDKENRSNRFDGKRVLDARKAQEGPREPRSREERNNRRNRGPNEEEGSQANPNAPSAGGFGSETQPQRYGGEGRRGGRGGGRGGGQGGERRGDRVERGDRGERPDRGDRGDRGERRGGEGGGRGGPRTGGKRDFDRKSGDDRTGVKAVDKREGGGSHNWGTFEDEMKADDDKVNTSTDDALNETAASGDNGEAMHTESGGEENREPEEPKVMTLDEWKKQQGERSGPKFNLRKAGEGSEIDPKWKKTVAYKKEKETHEDDEDEEHELYPQRVNRQKRLMDIEINFADSSRGGPGGAPGGRGGRGGPRGRGGDRPPRGGPREPRGEPREPREPRGEGERGDRGEPRPERGEPRAERGGDRPPRGERRGGRGGERGGPPSGGKGRGRSHAEAPNVNDELSFPSLG